jgi:hypothetical protein
MTFVSARTREGIVRVDAFDKAARRRAILVWDNSSVGNSTLELEPMLGLLAFSVQFGEGNRHRFEAIPTALHWPSGTPKTDAPFLG